jgi:hypothetical protein
MAYDLTFYCALRVTDVAVEPWLSIQTAPPTGIVLTTW